ncbi:signal transduction histidine kinase [Brevibacillus fulvus]|uniref:histidine kinase n=1 Tax=Brevibacillus fulvus TaxID=1125967 RepID=A0A938XVI6_9BACL|nr:sensor histidine kinase [Brevibacillus fulvus]MBM7591248.1 signal transduction histidine kinase [Brevibacillus fulvus]
MFDRLITAAIRKPFAFIWLFLMMLLTWLPNAYAKAPPLQFFLSFLLFCCYLCLFATVKYWKTNLRIQAAVLVLGIITLLKGFFFGNDSFGMMLLLCIVIGVHMEAMLSLVYAVIFFAVTSALILFTESSYLNVVSFVLTYIGCYIGARGYRVEKRAYQLNQQHLEELQKAHEELQDAHNELQEAAVQTMQIAVLEERARIARDIHDSLGHSLTSLIVQLHALQYMLHEGPAHAKEAVNNMLFVAKRSLEEIRSSVHTLAVDEHSIGLGPLRAFLSQTASNTGLACELIAPEQEMNISKEITLVFYRVLQEAVTNTLRHSNAKHLQVIVEKKAGAIILTILDDGKITKADNFSPGFGLTGMKERIGKLNGTLEYFPREPHGFQIIAAVPFQDETERDT